MSFESAEASGVYKADNATSSTSSPNAHKFCISTAEAQGKDKEYMQKHIKQLVQVQQWLGTEKQRWTDSSN